MSPIGNTDPKIKHRDFSCTKVMELLRTWEQNGFKFSDNPTEDASIKINVATHLLGCPECFLKIPEEIISRLDQS